MHVHGAWPQAVEARILSAAYRGVNLMETKLRQARPWCLHPLFDQRCSTPTSASISASVINPQG